MRSTLLITMALAGCGSGAPPGISIILSSDDSHPCAGAVVVRVTLAEVNGDTRSEELAAAIEPQQFECNFEVGVAEALFATVIGEVDIGVAHTVAIELHDSTGLVLAFGISDVFTPSKTDTLEPIELRLTRVVPVGTALVDLLLEPAFVDAPGDLDIIVDPIGNTRNIQWPGDDSIKRPLRVSGLPTGFDLRLHFDLSQSGTIIESYVTDTFDVGVNESDAFASPNLRPD